MRWLVAFVIEFVEDSCEDWFFDEVALPFVLFTGSCPFYDDSLTLGARPYTSRKPVVASRDEDEVFETSARQAVCAVVTIGAADQPDSASWG